MIRGVPYDHELEYSQGSQSASAVDIGVQMASVGRIRFRYSFVDVGASVTADDAFQSRLDGLNIDCYVLFNTRIRRLLQSLRGPGGTSYALGTITQQTWFDVTMDCDADSATINGVTYPATSHSGMSDQDRIYLHAGFHASRGKMYYFKTWDLNGNPQRDMVPVSDGNGRVYWYDRITRRAFFPTKAELVAGPVASTPLMGLHFYGFAGAKDYPQDGLIGMWHAKENVGLGAHDGRSLMWNNLAQNKWHLNLNNMAQWTGNSLRKQTTDGYYLAGTYNNSAYTYTLTDDDVKSVRTVEIVASWNGEWSQTGSSTRVCILFGWGAATSNGKYILADAYNNRFVAQARSGGSMIALGKNNVSAFPQGLFKISADFAETYGRPTRFTVNGVSMTDTGTANRDCPPGIQLGGPATWNYSLLGDIYSVRVYNRVLTNAEKTKSDALDRRLFGVNLSQAG